MRYLFTPFILLAFALTACNDKKSSDETVDPQTYINGFFPNEIKPATSINCFAGAYYRKVVTSKDRWIGITGKVVLPTITFDPERVNPAKPQQYMDNPSVYMGGNANGQETDIGMTWEVIRDASGNVTADRRAFRPFLRRTGYSSTGQQSNYTNAPAEERYYWYQGDTITLSLKMINNTNLLFTVEGMGKKFESNYQCDGYMFGSLIEFKRVNAIDLVGNEGKPEASTKTKVENSTWLYTKLWRRYNSEEYLVPIHTGRFTDMRCPQVKHFDVTTSDELASQGGEYIVIDAGR